MSYAVRILVWLLFLSGPVAAQQPQVPAAEKPEKQTPSFRVTSEAVRLDVFVTDKRGNPVPGLRAEDFEVLRNGEQQPVLTCSYVQTPETASSGPVSPAPFPNGPSQAARPSTSGAEKRWISIVVNDVRMSFIDIARVRGQLMKFVEAAGANDEVSIMQVSGGSGILLPFTSDKRVLTRLVDRIRFQLRGFGLCDG